MSKILEKAKKLRNLSQDNACTPEEAASYAAMLQDLLFKHNLDESDLQDEEYTPVYERELIDLGVSSPATKNWRASLYAAIAQFNFCKAILLPDKYIYLIGQEENREFVKYLYTQLESYLRKSQKAALKTFTKSLPFSVNAKEKTLWTKSFYIGAVNTIYTRLMLQNSMNIQEANNTNSGSGTALAIKVENALQDAVDNLVGKTKIKEGRKTKINSNGLASGAKAGNEATLNQSLGRRTALNA